MTRSAPWSSPRTGSDRPASSRIEGPCGRLADHGTEVLGESIGSVMTEKVFTCSRDDQLSAIMALMTNRRIRHIPVVEKDGRLCGMISIGDGVKHRLDEIQGEADALREYVTSAM